MNNEILDALSQITREKSVDRALLVETLEAGLASAVRKKYGATADVEVRFANETGQISVAIRRTVMETVEDPALQMTVEEARAYRPDARVGDVLTFPLSIAEFGRNAVQTAKQVLIQRVREAERERVFKEYSELSPSLTINRWYRKYGRQSPLRHDDWDAFRDPDELIYRVYNAMQDGQEAYVDGLLDEHDELGHDRTLPLEWVDTLARLYTPARYPLHAVQMGSAYLVIMTPAYGLYPASIMAKTLTSTPFFRAASGSEAAVAGSPVAVKPAATWLPSQ